MAYQINERSVEQGFGYMVTLDLLFGNSVSMSIAYLTAKRTPDEEPNINQMQRELAVSKREYPNLVQILQPYYTEEMSPKIVEQTPFEKAMAVVREDIDFDLGITIAQDKWERIFKNGLRAFEKAGK